MMKLLILVVLLGLFAGCGKSKWKVTMECSWSDDLAESLDVITITQADGDTADFFLDSHNTDNLVGTSAEHIEYTVKYYQKTYPKAKVENDKGFITVTYTEQYKLDSGDKDYAVKYLESLKVREYEGFNCTIK
ncbi:MAG: hypothetical protein LBR25_00050 [Erysipelotrichaceae bacterium]|jgi:hypothetical protein|nr:hypothetical protein [Erysipelotrichaceae bacterium]